MNDKFVRGQRAKVNFYEDSWNNYNEENVNKILDEVLEKFTNKNTNVRGKRSEILLVPDSKEYYKGINLVQWYWYRLVYKIKKLLHKGD